MRQFDVYANPNKTSRRAYPYIVDIQSNTISEIATRIVVPLGRKAEFKNEEMKRLTPTISYESEELLLLVPQIASMPAKMLREPIGSISHLRDEIVAALDFAVTGI
ncbi:plasmid maintenance protein CcdB [Mangrovimicrobium sediminis]|uniref:Toxin CcdB n=1 Tax=Mangrovimicrobium sediminis TaxID=2562682 RepID=A0A4Z0LUA6_9GAMM|nr:CcdB family protein [Haliea sp. SAOS-164]TGD70676.1 plasmid maintenance protein CcdB [Haliea sp. SAOS-164]